MTLLPARGALALSQLSDQSLRVRAVEAAAHYDAATLVELTHAYMLAGSRKGARTSPKTLQAYALAVRDFVDWARENGVTLLHPGRRDGGRYLAHLQARPSKGIGRRGGLSAATITQYLAGGRALYRALAWADATHEQPFVAAHAPADPTPGIVKNPPYWREIDQVLPHCDERLAALLLLCAHGGLRVSEALGTTIHDLQGGQLQVRGKGGRRRQVPLSGRARAALRLITPVDSQGHYFRWNYHQASYQMKKAFAAAGASWHGFHAARKHSGTRLYAATKDFTRVGLFLGHSSVDTTRRYVAVPEQDVAAEVEDF